MNLENKVAIVTGASSGIGRAIVYALASSKINITLIGRNKQKLKTLADELSGKGYKTFVLSADLSNEDETLRVVQKSHDYWGRTDILINNAGCCMSGTFHSGDRKNWKEMWQLNVLAPAITIQESLKYFDKNNGGHIINISSMSAHRIVLAGSFYSVTKSALKAITETLRKELVSLGSKTRVSSISPGLVNTGFAQTNDFRIPENINKEKLDPDDVAESVLHILNTKPHIDIHDILLRSVHQYD